MTSYKAPANSGEQTLPGTDSDDGVDVTLIRWMLSLSPAERLATLERTVNGILELRERTPKI